MSRASEVVVLSAVRTAIGKYGGALKDKPLTEIAAAVVRESVRRAGVPPDAVGHVVFGNVIHTDPHDMYLARVAAVNGGIPVKTPAMNVNRLCGSGMQAIVSAAQLVRLGEAEVALAGGAESMSRSQYWMPGLRWGQRMNHGQVLDAMVGALTDPFDDVHMAITAEAIGTKWGISRAEQDEFAAESHRRAVEAIRHCVYREQILPIELKGKAGPVAFDTDEQPRSDATLESLARLRPVFDKNGTITAGNASGINDAAAALVLAERGAAEERGLAPLARLVDWAYAGVDPKFMGIGPVPAVQALLRQTGLGVEDIDFWEVNEAFAVQSIAVIRELGLPPARTNPNGGAIALGHPVGASGAILAVKAIYELQRIRGRFAVVTLCIGGGQGIAALFERL